MARAIAERELEEHRIRAEIANSRSELYARVIHETNGALTVVSGFADIIGSSIGGAQRIEREGLDLVKDALSRITRQVAKCTEISRRYLGFLRQDFSESSMVSINEILTDLRECLVAHPSLKENRLAIHPLAKDVLVEARGGDLIQVLLNLTINALQAESEPHDVHVNGVLGRQPFELDSLLDGRFDRFVNREGFKGDGPCLALCVSDNGPGMPEDVLARLFTPYFTTKPHGQGTGLGLSIVERLVSEAHGLIHLHSRVGRGSTFTVYLPASLGS
jgi:signal transduction histidine kinase